MYHTAIGLTRCSFAMHEILIDNSEPLEDFCAQLKNSAWIAIDTEFMREKTYYPNLGLIQISDGQTTAAVDPLALDNLDPLKELMLDQKITKVFHAARQDLEIFLNLWKVLPTPVFDTQPAASLLGYGEQIGYAKLIKTVLNIDLPKEHSRTDWLKRPLSDGQLRYALDDVIYLGRAYQEILNTLRQKDRLHWLEEEFKLLVDTKTYYPHPDDQWQRVKGRQHLKGVKLAVLQKLAAWRETRAMEKNLPRRWILKDEVLIDLARRTPETTQKLGQIRGLDPALIRKIGKMLLDEIAMAKETPRELWPDDKSRPSALSAQQEAMLDYLNCALRLIAEQNQISPAAIASKKDLEKLLRNEKGALDAGWRHALAGEKLTEIVTGKLSITHTNGVLEIK